MNNFIFISLTRTIKFQNSSKIDLYLELPSSSKHVHHECDERAGHPWAWWWLSWHGWRRGWYLQTDPPSTPLLLPAALAQRGSGTSNLSVCIINHHHHKQSNKLNSEQRPTQEKCSNEFVIWKNKEVWIRDFKGLRGWILPWNLGRFHEQVAGMEVCGSEGRCSSGTCGSPCPDKIFDFVVWVFWKFEWVFRENRN